MKRYYQIEGNKDLVRDPTNMAVINKNTEAAKKAKIAKDLRMKKEQEFEQLKNDVKTIKDLLNTIVNKIKEE